jgi:hypothetical protein
MSNEPEQTSIEFALVGLPDSPPPGHIDQYEWEMTWEERSRAVVTLSQDASLEDAIGLAIAELRLTPWIGAPSRDTVGWIAFHDDADARPLYQRHLTELTLVGEDGRAHWQTDFSRVSLRQLIASGRAGTIPGDPHRIYLIRQVPQGDFFGVEWAQLVQLWEAAWLALDKIDTILGVGAGAWAAKRAREAKKAKEAYEAARAATTRALADWIRRGAQPDSIGRLLKTKLWRADELGDLLGIANDETEGLLEVFGFEKGDDGLYRPRPTRTDLLSQIDREVERAAERAMSLGFSPAVIDWSRERIERTIETGEEVPYQQVTPEELGPFPDEGIDYTDDRLDGNELDGPEDEEDYTPTTFGLISLHTELLILVATIVLLGLAAMILVDGSWVDHLLAFAATCAVAVTAVVLLSRLFHRVQDYD